MGFTVYSATDPEWKALLARLPHDVYHLPEWAAVCATHERWDVRLAVAERPEGILALPFMLRDLPPELPGAEGLRDITVPYGYPGPICTSSDPAAQAALFAELLDGFAELGAVSAFVRFHAGVGVPHESLSDLGEIVVHGHQVWVDVAGLPEKAEASFRADHRRNIRLLRDAGFTVEVDRAEHWEPFVEEYYATMRRLSSDPYYLFPAAYFETIRTALSDNAHLVAAVAPSGEPAAMALVLMCGEIGQYHLSGTNDAYVRLAASKLAVLGMVDLCREHGVKALNLGGGLGGKDDSLFKFKSGFSKQTRPTATGRFVLDRAAYDRLSDGAGAPSGFFPAYRHGLSG